MLKYDEIVMSSENYFKEDLPVGQRLMFPAINPLSEKNKDISEKTIREHINTGEIFCVERLDGLLKSYHRKAA